MPLMKEDLSTKQEMKKDSEIPKKSLVSIVGSLIPFAPLVYEQFTGQKIPAMTGTIAEMNNSLSQLSLALTQILNNQQQLWNKLEALEKSASSQFTQLGNQFQSLKLTHTKERKEIEYNPQLEN